MPIDVRNSPLLSEGDSPGVSSATCDLEKSLSHCKLQLEAQMREIGGMKATIDRMTLELRAARESAKRARFLAFHDQVTSLPNRRYFVESVGGAFRAPGTSSPSFSIALIDIQGLEALRDALGHTLEERVLRIVAARLWNAVRAEDLVCHLGGCEYACLIYGVSQRSAVQTVAATLHDAVSEPMHVEAVELFLKVSIGVATAPNHGSKTEYLMKAADDALGLAKRKNVATCFPENAHDAQALRVVRSSSDID